MNYTQDPRAQTVGSYIGRFRYYCPSLQVGFIYSPELDHDIIVDEHGFFDEVHTPGVTRTPTSTNRCWVKRLNSYA